MLKNKPASEIVKGDHIILPGAILSVEVAMIEPCEVLAADTTTVKGLIIYWDDNGERRHLPFPATQMIEVIA